MAERPPTAAAAASAKVSSAVQPMLPKPPGQRDAASAPAPAKKPMLQRPPGYVMPGPSIPQRRPLPTLRQYPVKPPPAAWRRRGGRRFFCRSILWISVAAILILSVAGGLAYLWFQPRLPSFRIQSLHAPHFNLTTSPGGGGSSALSATAAVAILASNPNGKISLSYGDLDAAVSVEDDDGDVDLGVATAPGFVQGRRNSTVLRFAVTGIGIAIDDAAAARLRSRSRGKGVEFAVEVRTKVGVRVGRRSTGRLPIRLLCGEVNVKQGAAAASPPRRRCTINLFRWVNLR